MIESLLVYLYSSTLYLQSFFIQLYLHDLWLTLNYDLSNYTLLVRWIGLVQIVTVLSKR